MASFEDNYFTFTMGTFNSSARVHVKVFEPKNTLDDIPWLTSGTNKPQEEDVKTILNFLQPHHLVVPPNPPATLVKSRDVKFLRIDTQPVRSAIFRKFNIQLRNVSFAEVVVDHGAEFCSVAGYENKLLKYIKDGLMKSLKRSKIFKIAVLLTPENNSNYELKWTLQNDINKVVKEFASRLNHYKEVIKVNRLESAKLLNKISRSTELIDHVVATIETYVHKLLEEEDECIIAKKISIVSTFMSVFFGTCSAAQEDFVGAFVKMASGVLGDIPGIGSVASVTIDVGLMGKDILEVLKQEGNYRRLFEDDKRRLKKENDEIRKLLAVNLPESPIFGAGKMGYYDESDLANVDDIISIHVRSGDLIDGIQIEYRHSGMAKYHGGKGGELSTLSLASDERVIIVRGTVYKNLVSSLTFITDYGRKRTFGVASGESFIYEMTDGSYLAGIKGYNFYADPFGNICKNYPTWAGNFELLPAVGFVAKF